MLDILTSNFFITPTTEPNPLFFLFSQSQIPGSGKNKIDCENV